ncbi:HAMP domain-containing histidine kinase [Flavobacteriaceae bacterium TK19130]|nr:HAMP domain-containing histidine kinase [Thermobacterium salinum]
MQSKSKVLVVFSIFTLIALIAIQGYLIYNTYELKQKTITIDARNAIAKVYNTPEVDSIAWLYRNDFLSNLELYKQKEISKQELVNRLERKSEAINPGFKTVFDAGLQEYHDKFDVQIKKIVTSISITDSLGKAEQIYPLKEQDTILLLGKYFPQEDGLLINNSTWQKDHDIITVEGTETFDLNFQSSIYMNITNWNALLLRELSGLLIAASALLLFVVALFYYSLQNLMKQKRVAEIKTDFINNITHELKTPLSTLSLATKTLTSEQAKQNETMRNEAIQIIERQNSRLQNLIDQVLKSSLGYQQIQLSKEEFNPSVFLNRLIEDYKLSLDKEVDIQKNIDNTGLTLTADPFFLGTAIINILNNAVKYGGTQLNFTYDIEKETNQHRISIADNGIGISKKYQKYIFDKFFRIGEKNKHNYKGLGLGLYYAKQIIIAHEGSILVESETGEGTTFIIKLPIVS